MCNSTIANTIASGVADKAIEYPRVATFAAKRVLDLTPAGLATSAFLKVSAPKEANAMDEIAAMQSYSKAQRR